MSRRREHTRSNGAATTAPSTSGVPAKRLMQSVRQRRHRAALLRAAAQWITASFTTAMGDAQPRLVIHENDGRTEPADIDVVADIVADFECDAEKLRLAIVALLDKQLGEITESDVPMIEGSERHEETVGATRENTRRRNGQQEADVA